MNLLDQRHPLVTVGQRTPSSLRYTLRHCTWTTGQLQSKRQKQHCTLCNSQPVVCAASSASAKDAESKQTRHAFLHDFCMIIPYSGLIVAAGLVSIPLGSGWRGLQIAGAGLLELLLTAQSLRLWRQRRNHLIFTSLTAGLAGALTWHFWRQAQRRMALVPNTVLAAISLAAAMFLVYNVVAGGNPPKEHAGALEPAE